MPENTSARPREAVLVADRRAARRLSLRAAAERANVSASLLGDIERGHKRAGGVDVPVTASAGSLAKIAFALELEPADLDQAGRSDAGQDLRELLERKRVGDHLARLAGVSDIATYADVKSDDALGGILRAITETLGAIEDRNGMTEKERRAVRDAFLQDVARDVQHRAQQVHLMLRLAGSAEPSA